LLAGAGGWCSLTGGCDVGGHSSLGDPLLHGHICHLATNLQAIGYLAVNNHHHALCNSLLVCGHIYAGILNLHDYTTCTQQPVNIHGNQKPVRTIFLCLFTCHEHVSSMYSYFGNTLSMCCRVSHPVNIYDHQCAGTLSMQWPIHNILVVPCTHAPSKHLWQTNRYFYDHPPVNAH
jgi:hypothetical protein